MKWNQALAAAREHFELRSALAGAARLDPAVRECAASLRLEARQKREASELLVTRGSPAEALQLTSRGIARMREAYAVLEAGGIPPPAALAQRLARATKHADELASAPMLDDAIASKHVALVTEVLRAQYCLDDWLRVASLDAKGLVRLRFWRLVRGAMGVVVLAGAIAVALMYFRAVGATASTEYGPLFAAACAVDGDPSTDWVAGTGEPDWLELRFRGKRSIHNVTLLNGHIIAHRSTKAFRIEVYDHGRAVRSVEGSFPEAPAASSVALNLAGAKGDRIVIAITSHYGDGAAISEVSVN